LKTIATAIGGTAGTKLSAAVVTIEDSSEVKIVIGTADVYDELSTLANDLEKEDYTGAGVQVGLLLAKIKSSSCATNMCIVVEGLLSSLQLGLTDFDACSTDLDATWTKMEAFLTALESRKWKESLVSLGEVISDLATDVSGCGVSNLGSILEDTATSLGSDSVAADIGTTVQILTNGADVTADIQKIIVAASNKQWSTLGSDLATLSSWVSSTYTCNSFACKLLEGILQEADLTLTDLSACAADLRQADGDFTNGTMAWGQQRRKDAISLWSAGLNEIAQAVEACGLSSQLSYLEQEANVLGLGNVTALGTAASILVHGTDIYDDMLAAYEAITKQDYRTAGTEFQSAISSLYKWTTGSLCTSDACYIFNGVMQYWSDLSADATNCKSDFSNMKGDFGAAFNSFISANKTGFTSNTTAIKAGVHSLGEGMQQLATSISDCHLEDLMDIVESLAAKLGVTADVTVIEEVLKILIEGVPIEEEIATALEDYGSKNWPGVGYSLIKLVKSLVETKSVSKQQFAIVV
jgi:hypothetical protein